MDGALFAAAALRVQGHPPLVVDLEAVFDDDHVIAVFRERGCWGAVARSNYSGLRFREPVYPTLRALVLSYFESYFNLRREKTLRRYSRRTLRRVLTGSAALGCVAYASWAFDRPGLGTWRELSIVPFVLWLGRYLMMLRAGAGEAPEELILRDRPLLALSFVWAALFTGGVYGGA